jgi:hypothetical protein
MGWRSPQCSQLMKRPGARRTARRSVIVPMAPLPKLSTATERNITTHSFPTPTPAGDGFR